MFADAYLPVVIAGDGFVKWRWCWRFPRGLNGRSRPEIATPVAVSSRTLKLARPRAQEQLSAGGHPGTKLQYFCRPERSFHNSLPLS